MKKMMLSAMIVAVLSFGIPYASAAESSADLDPMVSPDVQATVKGESSNNTVTAPTSNVVSTADAVGLEKKATGAKKEKSKKKSDKKSSAKKGKKSSSKKTKKSAAANQ